MTLKQFRAHYNGLPETLDAFASAAERVTNDVRLSVAGKAWTAADAKFKAELERVGVEVG